ncbi:MAG: D-2-hydroxyacid dehydrogenase [Sulfobacillus sp.]
MANSKRFARLVIYHPSSAQAYAQQLLARGVASVVAVDRKEDLWPACADAEAVACWDFPPELWPKLPKLRWIQVLAAGVDHLVDQAELSPQVQICRAVGPFGEQMSEWALAEMLAQVRGLDRLRRQQSERLWQRFVPATLAGSVLGIAGMGAIGQAVAKRARAFGMTVHGLSRGRTDHGADRSFRPGQWIEFAASCDWLLLLLPLTAETKGVVGPEVLAAMRPSAWLMNAGRGKLVDESALLAALDRHQIAGAILDVFGEEPLAPSNPLWTYPNVVVTPHLAAVSRVEDMADILYQNLCRDRDGLSLVHVVDRGRGY